MNCDQSAQMMQGFLSIPATILDLFYKVHLWGNLALSSLKFFQYETWVQN